MSSDSLSSSSNNKSVVADGNQFLYAAIKSQLKQLVKHLLQVETDFHTKIDLLKQMDDTDKKVADKKIADLTLRVELIESLKPNLKRHETIVSSSKETKLMEKLMFGIKKRLDQQFQAIPNRSDTLRTMLIDDFDEKADDIAYPRIATPVINEEGEQDTAL